MLNKIKGFTDTEDKKRLLSNFFSLSLLQIFTYLLPLITLPYLLRVLGVEKYGLVVFAQSFVMFFNIIVDYGFNLSATKDISINRNNRKKLNEIFTSVMVIKFCLLLFSFILLFFITLFFEKFSQNRGLFFLSFLWVLGQALFPIWYFQGIEKMKYITLINIIAKFLFTISIFIFVKEKSDYILVPFLNGLGLVVSGLFSLYIIFFKFKQQFNFKNMKLLKHFLAGFHVFLSSSAYVLLTNSPVFFIGLWLGDAMAGIYSAFDRIINAGKNLFVVIAQVLFPYMSRIYQENKDKYKAVYIRYVIVIISISVCCVTCVFVLSDWFIPLYFGEIFIDYKYIFYVLMVAMLIGVISNVLGLNGLLVMGKNKILSFSQLIPACVFISIAPFLLKFSGLSVFLSVYITCFLVIAVIRAYYVFKEFNYKKGM